MRYKKRPRKSEQINVRVSKDLKRAVAQAARRKRMRPGAWIRLVVETAILEAQAKVSA